MSEDQGQPALERYGPLRRALMILVGGAAALSGVGVGILVVILLVRSTDTGELSGSRMLEGGLAALFGVAVFLAFAAYGVDRLVRGVRGYARARFAGAVRAETWYQRNWYAVGLVFWAAAAVVSIFSARSPRAFLLGSDWQSRWAWYLFLAHLVLPVHVAIHELGHAAAGALVGFRFGSLRVGWLLIRRDGRRIRFSLSPATLTGTLGFHAVMAESDGALGFRLALCGAAGPAATLAFAAACRSGAVGLGSATTIAAAVFAELLWAGWWIGVVLGAVNLVPFRLASGVASDGTHIWASLFPRTASFRALLQFHLRWSQGRRPCDWGLTPAVLLQAADEDRWHRETFLLAALCVAMDTGDTERVDECLQRAAEDAQSNEPAMRYELELQAAMIEAFRGNAAAARQRLARLGPHPGSAGYSSLAEAAVRLAEGQASEARDALEAWERCLAESGRAQAVMVGNEWAVERLRVLGLGGAVGEGP